MMHIFIHTYGRHNRQLTFWNLSPEVRERTYLVVQEREADLYDPFYRKIVLPGGIMNLTSTRQFLMENYGPYVCILDDDLEFAVRRDDDRTKFRKPKDRDIDELFAVMQNLMGVGHPLVGIAAREGANRQTDPYLPATRQMRVHAINTTLYRKLGIRFDRVRVMEDFDVTLQFLEAGYSNIVINDYVTNQSGSNTSGGCSAYRTDEVQAESAEKLALLHPGLVKVVTKHTKTSWGGKERKDVIVQWKRALATRRVDLLDCGEGENQGGEGVEYTKALE
jgi:hypothetical protein